NEDALIQAYRATTLGTPMEGAVLEIDTVNLDYVCACGYQQVITSDDLEGHMFICPVCGSVHEVDEAHDLELLEGIEASSGWSCGGKFLSKGRYRLWGSAPWSTAGRLNFSWAAGSWCRHRALSPRPKRRHPASMRFFSSCTVHFPHMQPYST